MLNFFRSNIRIIVWIIVLSFVAWGAGTFTVSQDDRSAYAGAIGKEQISHKEFLSAHRFYELITKTASDRGDPENGVEEQPVPPPSYDEIRVLTWQTLVLSRQAKQRKISVSDDRVRDEIKRLFSSGPVFNHAYYEKWVKSNFRGRARDFEEVVRTHLAAQEVINVMLENVPVTLRADKLRNELQLAMINAHVQDYQMMPEGGAS